MLFLFSFPFFIIYFRYLLAVQVPFPLIRPHCNSIQTFRMDDDDYSDDRELIFIIFLLKFDMRIFEIEHFTSNRITITHSGPNYKHGFRNDTVSHFISTKRWNTYAAYQNSRSFRLDVARKKLLSKNYTDWDKIYSEENRNKIFSHNIFMHTMSYCVDTIIRFDLFTSLEVFVCNLCCFWLLYRFKIQMVTFDT